LSFQKEFTLIIKGPPVALARPRLGKFNGRSVVFSRQSRLLKSHKREVAAQVPCGTSPLDGSVSLCIDYVMPIPSSRSQKKQNELDGRFHESKPDIDNLLKWTCDVLSGIVVADDRQVSCIQCKKRYGRVPRTEIEVYRRCEE